MNYGDNGDKFIFTKNEINYFLIPTGRDFFYPQADKSWEEK